MLLICCYSYLRVMLLYAYCLCHVYVLFVIVCLLPGGGDRDGDEHVPPQGPASPAPGRVQPRGSEARRQQVGRGLLGGTTCLMLYARFVVSRIIISCHITRQL